MLVNYAIPAFIALLLIEAVLVAKMNHERYELKDTLASLSMGVGNVIISALLKVVTFGALSFLYQFRLFELRSVWWVWVLLILAEDLCYYAFHRAGHEVRLGWAAHVNHHSSQRYNLSTALRQSWTTPITGMPFWWPLPLLGFDPIWILTAQSISLIYQFWIHTELIGKLGPLEWVLNTPSHHRVHHASDLKYLDKNYGGIFIIWDRLFGTFAAEQERPTYGLLQNIQTYNPLKIASHEWLALAQDLRKPGLTWSQRLRYALGPPGWSHDGSKQTVKQLLAAAASVQAVGPDACASPAGSSASSSASSSAAPSGPEASIDAQTSEASQAAHA